MYFSYPKWNEARLGFDGHHIKFAPNGFLKKLKGEHNGHVVLSGHSLTCCSEQEAQRANTCKSGVQIGFKSAGFSTEFIISYLLKKKKKKKKKKNQE